MGSPPQSSDGEVSDVDASVSFESLITGFPFVDRRFCLQRRQFHDGVGNRDGLFESMFELGISKLGNDLAVLFSETMVDQRKRNTREIVRRRKSGIARFPVDFDRKFACRLTSSVAIDSAENVQHSNGFRSERTGYVSSCFSSTTTYVRAHCRRSGASSP